MRSEKKRVMRKVEKLLAKSGYSVDRGEDELFSIRDGSDEAVRLTFKGGYFLGRVK